VCNTRLLEEGTVMKEPAPALNFLSWRWRKQVSPKPRHVIYQTARRHIPEDSDTNHYIFLMQSTTENTRDASNIDMLSGNAQGQVLCVSTWQHVFLSALRLASESLSLLEGDAWYCSYLVKTYWRVHWLKYITSNYLWTCYGQAHF